MSGQTLSAPDTEDLGAWLKLTALDLRPRLVRRLLDEMGHPAAILDAPAAALTAFEGMTPEVMARVEAGRNPAGLSRWLEFAAKAEIHVVPYHSAWYPALLREIPDPPVALFVRGQLQALRREAVAMVGTRAATRYGAMVAGVMARDLARAGMLVVSGGAVGIDAAAHRGAASAGSTVAVLGCGLDINYPSSNQDLFREVVRSGALLTEFGLGARPDHWRFPARNRIISGMCRAIIVVEAAEKSGALITASFAGEQGRDVMAVPGPIDSRQSRGCHALIRDGAALVENAEQVLSSMGWLCAARPDSAPEETPAAPPDLPIDQGALLLALSAGQKHLDELTAECGLTASQAGAAATLLEMRGLIRRIPGNHFIRVL